MEFDSIKKSAIFQSTRAWPKATLDNVRSRNRIATSAVTYKHPSANAERDSLIEQDHSQRMMRFLQKIQKQKSAASLAGDPLQAVHADRIKRTLSRQILRTMSQRPIGQPAEQ